ncbi:serine-rich adhesin for platelets-like isoform X2 [Mytilus edulis]|uniref:serine-rich adhesin for platelets-like isoform X2 n=1 Tax=Mytilus edulis TaxID=6550 RepID=UPI0039EE08D3
MEGNFLLRLFTLSQGLFLATSSINHHDADSNSTVQDPCGSFSIIDDNWRYVNNTVADEHCDMDITEGWYRMDINGRPATIPTVCIKGPACGVRVPLHIEFVYDAPLPGQIEDASICGSHHIEGKWDCCVLRRMAQVKNCEGFYVYKLTSLDRCNAGYCVIDQPITCNDGYLPCVDNKKCYHNTTRCNNEFDCFDRSDEDNCQPVIYCPEGSYKCGNGRCAVKSDDCRQASFSELSTNIYSPSTTYSINPQKTETIDSTTIADLETMFSVHPTTVRKHFELQSSHTTHLTNTEITTSHENTGMQSDTQRTLNHSDSAIKGIFRSTTRLTPITFTFPIRGNDRRGLHTTARTTAQHPSNPNQLSSSKIPLYSSSRSEVQSFTGLKTQTILPSSLSQKVLSSTGANSDNIYSTSSFTFPPTNIAVLSLDQPIFSSTKSVLSGESFMEIKRNLTSSMLFGYPLSSSANSYFKLHLFDSSSSHNAVSFKTENEALTLLNAASHKTVISTTSVQNSIHAESLRNMQRPHVKNLISVDSLLFSESAERKDVSDSITPTILARKDHSRLSNGDNIHYQTEDSINQLFSASYASSVMNHLTYEEGIVFSRKISIHTEEHLPSSSISPEKTLSLSKLQSSFSSRISHFPSSLIKPSLFVQQSSSSTLKDSSTVSVWNKTTTVTPDTPRTKSLFLEHLGLFIIVPCTVCFLCISFCYIVICIRRKVQTRSWTCRQEEYYTKCEKDLLMTSHPRKSLFLENPVPDEEMLDDENQMTEKDSLRLSLEIIDIGSASTASLHDSSDGYVIPISELEPTEHPHSSEDTKF